MSNKLPVLSSNATNCVLDTNSYCFIKRSRPNFNPKVEPIHRTKLDVMMRLVKGKNLSTKPSSTRM